MVNVPTGKFEHPAGTLIIDHSGRTVRVSFKPNSSDLPPRVDELDWFFLEKDEGTYFDGSGTALKDCIEEAV